MGTATASSAREDSQLVPAVADGEIVRRSAFAVFEAVKRNFNPSSFFTETGGS